VKSSSSRPFFLFASFSFFVDNMYMWIKDLNMRIKKCRVTSKQKNFGENPKTGGKHYTYGYNTSNVPPGQGKFKH